MERVHNFSFFFFVSHEKSTWEMFFFFPPNLVGCGWEGLLRVGVVWLLTINGSRIFLWFDKLVVDLSLCVCVCVYVLFKLFHILLLEQLLCCRYCIYSPIIGDKVPNFTELIFNLSQKKIIYFF